MSRIDYDMEAAITSYEHDMLGQLDGEARYVKPRPSYQSTIKEVRRRAMHREARRALPKAKTGMHEVERNKFYVGSNAVFERNWGHPDLARALKHAREILDRDDKDYVFIVKIIKVVKRAPRPAVVIDVK